MINKHGWLAAVLVVAFLVTACGPRMATPTARVAEPTDAGPSSTAAVSPTAVAPTETAPESQVEPIDPADLPVDADDWHALGAPDAPVTIIEYSDFQ